MASVIFRVEILEYPYTKYIKIDASNPIIPVLIIGVIGFLNHFTMIYLSIILEPAKEIVANIDSTIQFI